MRTLLASYPKTVPNNYEVKGEDIEIAGAGDPGYSLTPDQWEKAIRMEDPNYDWNGYTTAATRVLFDHPSLAHKEHDEAQLIEWNNILNDLEPFNRRPY
jgi:hypothetical protein